MEQISLRKANSRSTSQQTTCIFMEPKGSQESATGSYPGLISYIKYRMYHHSGRSKA
jgi:hypothetical protein